MRRQIRQFPIWRPGDAVSAGDVGTLDHGVFQKMTTLSGIYPALSYSLEHTSLHNPYLFVSNGCRKGAVQLGAPIQTGAVQVAATMKIDFGNRGGVIFAATDLSRRAIEDFYHVREYVKAKREQWPKDLVLAVSVERAGSFRAVVSESVNGGVVLSGDAKALGAVNIADASVSLEFENAAGYDSQRASGPIVVTAYGFGWWARLSKNIELFEYGGGGEGDGAQDEGEDEDAGEDEDFREISAADYVEIANA